MLYPKIVKPPRTYPTANAIMALRLRVNQAPPTDPVYGRAPGSSVLKANQPFHVGTIPAGSFILPALRQVKLAFTAGTLTIGTEDDPDAILTAADSALTTPGVTSGLVGAATGIATDQLVLWAVLSAASAVGQVDIVVPFYTQRD